MPDEREPSAGAGAGSAGPGIGVALFCIAGILAGEAGFAGGAGAAVPGTANRPVLLAAAGLALALAGLLLCLGHWSVQHVAQRTPHPAWHGFIVLWGGLSFAALYLAELFVPIPLEREDVLLVAIVESVSLLWLLGWIVERWHSAQ